VTRERTRSHISLASVDRFVVASNERAANDTAQADQSEVGALMERLQAGDAAAFASCTSSSARACTPSC
jgi:hypothetical protein